MFVCVCSSVLCVCECLPECVPELWMCVLVCVSTYVCAHLCMLVCVCIWGFRLHMPSALSVVVENGGRESGNAAGREAGGVCLSSLPRFCLVSSKKTAVIFHRLPIILLLTCETQ